MGLQWLGHPLCVVIGAITISTIITAVVDPLPVVKSSIGGRIEINFTFLSIIVGAAALGHILFMVTHIYHVQNGVLIAILWPLIAAESLIGAQTVKQLTRTDIFLLIMIILVTFYGTLFAATRFYAG